MDTSTFPCTRSFGVDLSSSFPSSRVVPRRRNADSGKYEQVYSTEDIVELLRNTRLGTSEIADELSCHRTTAHDRLHELEEEGIVTFEQVGNTQIWSLVDEDCDS